MNYRHIAVPGDNLYTIDFHPVIVHRFPSEPYNFEYGIARIQNILHLIQVSSDIDIVPMRML